ncbi:MAG: M24 family metallopeptidase [Verrucomicrobiota bacterium]
MAQNSAKSSPALLLYADTARSADLRHFARFTVPDPMIALRVRGEKIGVLNALEYGRAKKSSGFDTVLALEPLVEQARRQWPDTKPGPAEIIALLARKYRVKSFTVPDDFPAGLCDRVRAHGLALTTTAALFPEREFKTPAEIRALREGNRASAAGIAAAERLLRAAKIERLTGRLVLDGQPLTSERLKTAIEIACLEADAVSADTIAAGGDQACDPHEHGHGPLRANELIIVDVFPRVTATGYHGDMTRTFLKGRATDAQQKLVAAVRAAQLAALHTARAGVNGRHVHQQCLDVFARHGFETKNTPKGWVGFFHGTGHGLGLDVHEAPRVSKVDHILQKNTVVTIEPGLYYPGLGGCRIEDVVQITAGKPKLLSDYHYDWEIR